MKSVFKKYAGYGLAAIIGIGWVVLVTIGGNWTGIRTNAAAMTNHSPSDSLTITKTPSP